MNNLGTKVDNLNVKNFKTAPVDLIKLSDLVSKELVKNTNLDKLNIKVNNLENKTPNPTTLVHINQYNTDKQSLEKKIGHVDKTTHDLSDNLLKTQILTN